MSYHVEIAESAERDLMEITDVVAFAYGDAIGADRLARRILDAIESLDEMPHRYPLSRNPVLAALDCHQFIQHMVLKWDGLRFGRLFATPFSVAKGVSELSVVNYSRVDLTVARRFWYNSQRSAPRGAER